MNKEKKKYIIVFIITVGIFLGVFALVEFLDSKKRESISSLQRSITMDLIASETQFELLKNTPCKAIGGSILSRQLGDLGEKLSYAEETQGIKKEEIIELKKYYSLLQVKDYLLSEEVAQKCNIDIASIIYFYEQDCPNCIKQGYVLNELKRKYPWLRIYSFDLNLDFSILETFSGLYEITEDAPIIIIGDKKYSGFKSVEEVEAYIPDITFKKELEKIKLASKVFLEQDEKFSVIKDITFVSYEGDKIFYTYKDEKGTLKDLVLQFNREKNTFSYN